ncbi:MAG: hypothetical protein FWD51_02910 [Betaproteobacteria bacterium]|nr:hypothetical protein [Betaproteobacteria bacterium]
MSRKNGRMQRGQENESDVDFTIAGRFRFGRFRDKNAWKRSLKMAIINCADRGEIWPETAEYLIRSGGLRHV